MVRKRKTGWPSQREFPGLRVCIAGGQGFRRGSWCSRHRLQPPRRGALGGKAGSPFPRPARPAGPCILKGIRQPPSSFGTGHLGTSPSLVWGHWFCPVPPWAAPCHANSVCWAGASSADSDPLGSGERSGQSTQDEAQVRVPSGRAERPEL